MLIRCEKCSTLYELDEKLLPPQGAPVQCSKCQFVFKAYPPSDQGRGANGGVDGGRRPALQPVPAPESDAEPVAPDDGLEQPEPAEEAPVASGGPGEVVREGGMLASGPRPRPPAAHEPIASDPAARTRGGDEPRFTADGRPIRKVPFPTASDAPPVGVRPTAVRVPPARRPRTLDPAMLMRWVIVAVVLIAIAIGAALAWRTYRGRRTREQLRPLPGQSVGEQQSGTAGSQPRK